MTAGGDQLKKPLTDIICLRSDPTEMRLTEQERRSSSRDI